MGPSGWVGSGVGPPGMGEVWSGPVWDGWKCGVLTPAGGSMKDARLQDVLSPSLITRLVWETRIRWDAPTTSAVLLSLFMSPRDGDDVSLTSTAQRSSPKSKTRSSSY